MLNTIKTIKDPKPVQLKSKLIFTLAPMGSYALVFQNASFQDIALIESCLDKLQLTSRKVSTGSYLLYKLPTFLATLQFVQLWARLITVKSEINLDEELPTGKDGLILTLFVKFSGVFIGVLGPDTFIPFSIFSRILPFSAMQPYSHGVIYFCAPIIFTTDYTHATNSLTADLFTLF